MPDGLAVRGSDAQNNRENASRTVNDWLTSLGYKKRIIYTVKGA